MRLHRPRVCSAVLAAVAAAAGARAQDAGEPATTRFAADVAALTAPRMAGREPGTPGGRRAEDYLASRFEAIGLQPVPGLDGFRQPFDVADPRPVRVDGARTKLRSASPDRPWVLEVGADFLPFGFSAEGEAAGPLVFAGHGLTIPELDRDDFAGLEVAGAVVLVLRGAPGWRDAGSPFRDHQPALRFTEKIAAAVARGAAGFLLADPDTVAGGERDRDLVARASRARGTSPIPAAWITWSAAQRLMRGGVPAARRADGELPAARGAASIRVELAVRFDERPAPRRTANLVGLLSGCDPGLREEIVVVGAHHDHIGLGQYGSLRIGAVGQVHPGADDNASGCAGLLAVAEHLASGPEPRRSVLFVAFGAEELGMRGSGFLLESELVPAGRVVAMVNLNMIGRATPDRLRIEGVGSGAGFEAWVREAAAAIPGCSPPLTRAAASPRSDHAPFLARRIPVLFVHSGLHADYHTPDDTAERVLVAEAVGASALTAGIVRRIADTVERPAFIEVVQEFRRR